MFNAEPKIKKGVLLYFLLIPLFISVVVALLAVNIEAFILNSIAFLLFLATLKISKMGFVEEFNYHRATLAKAPKIPFKLLGSYMLGASTFFASYVAGGKALVPSLFLAAISIAGYYLYYGTDPKEDKLADVDEDVNAQMLIKTLQGARVKLHDIEIITRKIEDPLLHAKITNALNKSELILKTIEKEPRGLSSARKFLVVYIDGIKKVADSYVDTDKEKIDDEMKTRLYDLMDDVDTRFDKELDRLKENNLFELDVHIDVLKQQLKH